jgi:hypothetical protein
MTHAKEVLDSAAGNFCCVKFMFCRMILRCSGDCSSETILPSLAELEPIDIRLSAIGVFLSQLPQSLSRPPRQAVERRVTCYARP